MNFVGYLLILAMVYELLALILTIAMGWGAFLLLLHSALLAFYSWCFYKKLYK